MMSDRSWIRKNSVDTKSDAWRPRLWHLFVWMTGCAVYFAIARQFLTHAPTNAQQLGLLLLLALYTGLCWTGAVVAMSRVFGRSHAVLEPGTWLLFSLGCIFALDLVSGIEALSDQLAVRRESIILGGTCLAFTLPVLSRRLPGHWKAVFATLAILLAGKLVWLLAKMLADVPMSSAMLERYVLVRSILGMLLLGLAVFRDRQLDRQYGWLHWTGIFCTLVWLLPVTDWVWSLLTGTA